MWYHKCLSTCVANVVHKLEEQLKKAKEYELSAASIRAII